MRDLAALLRPRSVAVIGASSTLTSLAGRPVKNLIDSPADIDVYPVNPRRDEIGGLRCYPDIAAVPVAVDVALILVPAAVVAETLEAAGRAGAKAAIVITAGFAEMGDDGARQQAELAAIARRHGMALLGPNTIGLHDYRRGLPLSFVWFGRQPESDAGSVAVVTQSGSGMAALCDRLNDAGLPLGLGVATGNESDVTVADLIEHLADDDDVRVVATVFEGIDDGPAFLRAVARLREAGKPLIALKLGRTPSGSHMAASHTGSLAGEYATVRAVLRQHGVVEIDDLDDFAPTIAAALSNRFPAGLRIAAVSSSGAATVICADRADELGLTLPPFSDAAQERITPYLPSFSNGAHNPLDLTAQAMEHRHAMTDILEIALDEEQFDAVIVGTPSGTGPKGIETADRLADLAARYDKPFYSFILTGEEAAAQRDRQWTAGIHPFSSPGKAVEAAARLARFGMARSRFASDADASDDGRQTDDGESASLAAMSEYQALAWLAEQGIPTVPQELASSAEAAVAAADRIGYPVAVKVSSADIAHKTEIGGVALGLSNADAVAEAFAAVIERARSAHPGASVEGVTVSPMVDAAYELIAGIHRDATFGPVLAFGLGGIWAEVLKDVSLRALPVRETDIPAMIDDLRGAALLDGARGYPAADRTAIADLLVTLSRIAERHGDRLGGLDLNPVAVTQDGRILALDAAVYP